MKKIVLLLAGSLVIGFSSCKQKTYSCECTKSNGEVETEGVYDEKHSDDDAEKNCASKSDENRTCKAVIAG